MSKNGSLEGKSGKCQRESRSRRRLERPIAFDSQVDSEYLAVCRHNHVSLIVKAKSDNSNAGHRHLRFSIRRAPPDAPIASGARRPVNISLVVKRQPLRPPESREESGLFAVRADFHHRIK